MTQAAIDRASILRANYREALMRGDKDPKNPIDFALDCFKYSVENYLNDRRHFWREVIHILSEKEEEVK